MHQRLMIALGGNALGQDCQEQAQIVRNTARSLVDLVAAGYELVISHGNGPQVGMIKHAFDQSHTFMPFPECGAMSQGYIGYHLQNALYNELAQRGLDKTVTSLVTQVVVDSADPAFQHPTKPIGSFYSEAEAKAIMEENPHLIFKEDAGRGWRRVVPSPKPCDIVEKAAIKDLLDRERLVISVGGGGIPVTRKDGQLEGVAAVIDKDFASSLLARMVQADGLVILTTVDQVAINFQQPNQQNLGEVTCQEMRQYIAEGMFAVGSMLPKVEAALDFVESDPRRFALITSLECAKAGLAVENGTRIRQG